MNNTTRTFPRSLSDAFPFERAFAIEHYRPHRELPLLAWLVLLVVAAVLAAAVVATP